MSDPNNELESLHELPQQPREPPADEVVAELEGDPVTADDADPESPGPGAAARELERVGPADVRTT